MFINLRMIRKGRFLQLTVACFVLSTLMINWEQLDHHVLSHLRSISYRYLVNRYNFINESFLIGHNEADSLKKYPYLINHKHKCNDKDVLLLLLVKSSPVNFKRRQSIRSTWGNERYIQEKLGVYMRVMFALGVHDQPQQREQVQQELLREDQRHHDLIQQDFLDTFHNLTAKLILQFRWAHDYCGRAKFLMSADDDVFIHVPNLISYLQDLSQNGVRDLWVGCVHKGSPPVRHKHSKYYVPYNVYQWVSYPDYTAGGAYVVSGDVIRKIYHAAMTLNSTLFIDDVFMGICASTVGVLPQGHSYFSGEGKAPYHPCIYDKMMTSHGHLEDLYYLWKAATDPKVQNISTGLIGKLYCTTVKVMFFCNPYFKTYSCMAAFS